MMDVTVIGGGMIVHDQILPSLYQLQRIGVVGEITVCSRRESTLNALRESETIRRVFPERSFRGFTGPYNEALRRLKPAPPIAVIALPDHLHCDAILRALEAGCHVISVKPLVLNVADADRIEREARTRGLFVGIEYHKRLDDRSLMARRKYRAGEFGEFRLGTASLLEKWYYLRSNFQNWCTTENSDP